MSNQTSPAKSTNRRSLALCAAGLLVAALGAGAGCVNSRLSAVVNGLAGGTLGSSGATGTTGSTVNNFVIGNVLPAPAPTGGNGSPPAVTVYIDPSQSTSAGGISTPPILTQFCSNPTNGGAGATGSPCNCLFTWSETNTSTGNSTPFTRSVTSPVTNVQQDLAVCSAPAVYLTEITDGTTISVTIQPGNGNPNSGLFTFNTFQFTKETNTTTGSFQNALGQSFENIVHYSCYEQFQIGNKIQSQMGTKTNSQTGESTTYPVANAFCIQTPGQQASPNCPNLPTNTVNSAQAYYYNLFARVSVVGEVNQWNDRYTCPEIKEPIYNGGPGGMQGNLYPMDTNFALMTNSNPPFTVGVNGFVELADGGGDPISANATLCDGTAGPNNGSTDGFVQACLGFAQPPNADGTCPYFTDASGAAHFTYRLRRFIALYPPLFPISGNQPTTSQRSDVIYVLDRPVTPPSNANPLQPYTMRGPKPCPFSMFDSKGVLNYADPLYTATGGKLPIYASTSNPLWSGTNVDGVTFPNTDGVGTCSTAMPLTLSNVLNPDLNTISIGTVNAANPVMQQVYVRPINAWAPHYEEDTSFQACAPQASPLRDPPLHFAKDNTTGNVAWCAEVYPSQNDNVPALDQLYNTAAPPGATNGYIGHVRPYTSHVAKNSLSADCTATIPTTIPAAVPLGSSTVQVYPLPSGQVGSTPPYNQPSPANANCQPPTPAPAGLAWHPSNALQDTKNIYTVTGKPASPPVSNVCANQTCDRTAIIPGGVGWTQFPLLASAYQTEQAISSDSTFGCVLTYDNGGPKTGKVTPTGGCCGPNVILNTGFKPVNGAPTTPGIQNTTAHLEPDVPCLIPAY